MLALGWPRLTHAMDHGHVAMCVAGMALELSVGMAVGLAWLLLLLGMCVLMGHACGSVGGLSRLVSNSVEAWAVRLSRLVSDNVKTCAIGLSGLVNNSVNACAMGLSGFISNSVKTCAMGL